MSDSKDLILLKKFHKSMKNQDNFETASAYISQSLKNSSSCFDINVLEKYKEDTDFVETCILHSILSLIDSKEKIDYASRYFRDFQIRSGKDYITEDEVFTSSIMSFIFSIFAIANTPNDSDIFENSFKNIIVALDLQGNHLKLGTYNKEKFLKTLKLPDNVLHTASDIYYSIWTFQIAHEIYHILCDEENTLSQENEADKFGYSILIKLIEMQKDGKLPDACACFYENTYLAPIILFEFFKLVDLWKQLCGVKLSIDKIHPSNEQRIDAIFSLFDELVPDDFDTNEGNEVLNNCLEAIDIVTNNIIKKADSGKLDSIIKQYQ